MYSGRREADAPRLPRYKGRAIREVHVFGSILTFAIAAFSAEPAGLEIAAEGDRTSYDVDVFVRFDGNLYLADALILDTDLAAALQAVRARNPNARVVVSADEKAPHGRVLQVLRIVEGAGAGRVALVVGGTSASMPDDPLFPGAADALEGAPVTALDEGLTKEQLRKLKPKRYRFPQNPYGSTDFTAYTVEWGETKIGLVNVQHGIAPRTQIGTVPLLDAFGVLNANVKGNILRERGFDFAILGNYFAVPVTRLLQRFGGGLDLYDTQGGEEIFTSSLSVVGVGGVASLRLLEPWSLHAGLTYNRVTAAGQFNFDDLPDILVPDGEGRGGGVTLVPRLVGEAFQFRLATDLRFNRRDSVVFQFQTPLYAQARGKLSGEVAGVEDLEDFDFGISYDVWVPVSDAYRLALSYQFSWKHVDLRFGYGVSPIQGLWAINAFDLSYRFGGRTRREEAGIRKGYRENRRDLEAGQTDAR